ncbi:caspase family protein [Mesorhizobium sp. J428]|uniref:caspase family protein n=1 Tax=Mesorhizobium sp. J428 TaxID=2898440 RepID=UPI002150724E|nr:caspase family protein [Mesorhizobium sp. J428]MCR5855524.1 caspase family protein [Mesorhizobium sp. J428]
MRSADKREFRVNVGGRMATASLPMRRMIVRQALAALAACLIVFVATAAEAQDKALKGIALVIGQSSYAALPPLANPANDARLISGLLGDLGFEVSTVLDADHTRLSRALRRFAEDAEGSDVALLYFAGHGIEAGGENFLVPVDTAPDDPQGLVALSPLLSELQAAVPVTIMLLDACRTNPFPPGAMIAADGSSPAPVATAGLGALRGVVPMKKAGGTDPDTLGVVIGFAAEPGKAALDGAGGSSPYAAALAKHLPAAGFAFGDVMTMVTEEVYLATAARQLPWTNASLRRQLFFGLAPEEAKGDEAQIRGERRKLLLTIAATPLPTRHLVEQVASTHGVQMDELYGMLDVLGVDVAKRDADLGSQLEEGARRLKEIIASRDLQARTDPEIVRLGSLADQAEAEGAIRLALSLRERASTRAAEIDRALDEAEADIRKRRSELSRTFQDHAETALLNFDFETAALRYADAFGQIERYDVGRSYFLKVSEADAWADFGKRYANSDGLQRSLAAYETAWQVGRAAPNARRDAALRGNMAIVMTQLGERTMDAVWLQRAADIYQAILKEQPRERLPEDWAYTQLNLGSLYHIIGERTGDREALANAVRSFEGAAGIMTREVAPEQWAGLQMNLGNVHYTIANMDNDAKEFEKSYKAIERTLTIWTKEKTPHLWATAQSNLGGSYSAYGVTTGDTKFIYRGIAAHEAAMTVATREKSPDTWAQAQSNISSAYIGLGDLTGDPAFYRSAVSANRAARQVYTLENDAAAYAASYYNEGRVLLRIGRAENGLPALRAAEEALAIALRHVDRVQIPIQWARIRSVTGEVLRELGERGMDRDALIGARAAFEDARTTFRENGMGRSGQGFWEKQIAAIDAQLALPKP